MRNISHKISLCSKYYSVSCWWNKWWLIHQLLSFQENTSTSSFNQLHLHNYPSVRYIVSNCTLLVCVIRVLEFNLDLNFTRPNFLRIYWFLEIVLKWTKFYPKLFCQSWGSVEAFFNRAVSISQYLDTFLVKRIAHYKNLQRTVLTIIQKLYDADLGKTVTALVLFIASASLRETDRHFMGDIFNFSDLLSRNSGWQFCIFYGQTEY